MTCPLTYFWGKTFLSYQLHNVWEIDMTYDLDLRPTDLNIPYSGKFSLGSYFRDFADCIRSRENKNRNNLFEQKFKGQFFEIAKIKIANIISHTFTFKSRKISSAKISRYTVNRDHLIYLSRT